MFTNFAYVVCIVRGPAHLIVLHEGSTPSRGKRYNLR